MNRALVKFAVFAVIGAVLTVTVYNTISRPLSGSTRTYAAAFTNASGLQSGDDVRIAGVRVGSVQDVAVDGDHARVTFSVLRTHRVTVDTHVAIRYADLLGARYVALTDDHPHAPLQDQHATIPERRTSPALDLTALFNGFKPLLQALSPRDVNTLTAEIVAVLQGEGATVTSLLDHLGHLTGNLADRDAILDRVVVNLNDIAETVATHHADLATTVDTLHTLAAGLARDRAQIGNALAGTDQLASSLAGLLPQARPALHSDLASLLQVTATLADSHATLDTVVQRLPVLEAALMRVGDYGSWANTYVCDLVVALSGGGQPIQLGGTGPHSEVCR